MLKVIQYNSGRKCVIQHAGYVLVRRSELCMLLCCLVQIMLLCCLVQIMLLCCLVQIMLQEFNAKNAQFRILPQYKVKSEGEVVSKTFPSCIHQSVVYSGLTPPYPPPVSTFSIHSLHSLEYKVVSKPFLSCIHQSVICPNLAPSPSFILRCPHPLEHNLRSL